MNNFPAARSHRRLSIAALLAGIGLLLATNQAAAQTINVATNPVTGAGVVFIASDGLCSLREAIINANDGAQTHADCAAGGPSTTDVVLPASAVFTLTTAAVNDAMGRTGLPYITGAINLHGNGATIQAGGTCTLDGTQTANEVRLALVQGGVLTAEDLTLANGCADGTGSARDGGGIHVSQGGLVLRRVSLQNNRARQGGGIYGINNVITLVESSTLSGNTATFGGALYVDGRTDVFNSTLSGNAALSLGSSVYVQPDGVLNLEHATLDGLTAGQNVGIYSNLATVNIKNTILRNSRCEENSDTAPSTWNALGNNLDDGATCASLFGTNIIANANVNLGLLTNNGGSTETLALLPGSAAIDGAISCTRLDGAYAPPGQPRVNSDQRGASRPQGSACDIGAFELELPPSTIYVDAVEGVGVLAIADDGLCSLREAFENANGSAPNHADCVAGGGADIVVLPAGAVFTLDDGSITPDLGRTGLPQVITEMTLAGQGALLQRSTATACQIDGADNPAEFRLLLVQPDGKLTIDDLTLAHGCPNGDSQGANGGAILNNQGELIVRRSTFSDNQAGSSGGAIVSTGTTRIEASTLTGNSAAAGGALVVAGSSTTVRNSTLSGNTASEWGGAVFVVNSTLNLEHATLADNSAPDGGGIKSHLFGVIRAKNVLLQASSCANLLNNGLPDGNWIASGTNLDSDTSCKTIFQTNVTANANINLGPLADNGGTTQTHALLPGSAAINAANQCTALDGGPIATDQRGVPRPQGAQCDVGAFEVRPVAPGPATIYVDAVAGSGVIPVRGDGLCSLREAIENANSTSTSFSHGDCEAGYPSGSDVIELPAGAVFSLTDAAQTASFGNTGLPATSSPIRMEGNGATIESGNVCNFNGVASADEFRLLMVQSGTLELHDLTLANGCADGAGTSSARDGGAIHVQAGALIVEDVTLRGNRARRGGAIYSAGVALAHTSTLSGNSATFGGALYASADTRLSSVTVSGNSAASLGGAVFIEGGATLDIEQSTLDGNSSGQSNGIYASVSTVNLKNTILRNSHCAENSDLGPSTWNASGNNLDSANLCAGLFGANVTPNANADLAPLADNGGDTQTHALLPGSVAIDAAGSCTSLSGGAITSDQRGIARPQGVACDIGAVELLQYSLSVGVTGSGSVSAAASPAPFSGGISLCSSTGGVCAANYGQGMVVILTATPDSGAHFVSWSGACSGTASTSVTMDSAKMCVATFAPGADYSVGGTILGLTGTGLQLQLNGANPLTINPGATSFGFSAGLLHYGDSYAVTVQSQPADPTQTCIVSNGSGSMPDADVTNIVISCSTQTYSIGGAVSGLSGSGLTLQLNGANDLSIAGDGNFSFPTAIANGASYVVTVNTQPSGQLCSVSNAIGTVIDADINNVTVSCVAATADLSLSIDDGHAFARYGQTRDYLVTLTNSGNATAHDVAVTGSMSAGLDSANVHWMCIGAGNGASCTLNGAGPFADTVTLPANRSLSWIVTVPVKPDAADDTVTMTVEATGATAVSDMNILVIFRDGFDLAYADGTQAVTTQDSAAVLNGSDIETLGLPLVSSDGIDTLRTLRDGDSTILIQRLTLAQATWVRLLRRPQSGEERTSTWVPIAANGNLSIGSVAGEDGQRIILLEGASDALSLPLTH